MPLWYYAIMYFNANFIYALAHIIFTVFICFEYVIDCMCIRSQKRALSFEVPEDIPAVEESIVEGKT